MKVIYIRDSRSRGYLRIGVDSDGDKKEYTLSEGEYREIGAPLVGDEIADIEALCLFDMKYTAVISALRILAYGDNNRKTLVRKLTARSVPPAVAEKTADEMVALGYINERAQLSRIIEREANSKLLGRKIIVQRLAAKGFDKSEISEVLSDLISHGIVDFEKIRQELVEKRLPKGAGSEEKKRLLYKYGH